MLVYDGSAIRDADIVSQGGVPIVNKDGKLIGTQITLVFNVPVEPEPVDERDADV